MTEQALATVPVDDDPEPGSLPPIRHPQLGEPTAVYEYQRASRDLVFVVCRFEPKDFRPAQLRGGRWRWNLDGAPILPYRLPELEAALAAGETVWIVDGEKDADALAAAGVTATCCARSQGWTVELAEQLTGARRIRIVADSDGGTGERQARDLARLLVDAGAIASCDVDLVQAAEGKDAYDHLAAGRALDEFELLSPEVVAESRLRVVPLADFAANDEVIAEPLVGDGERRLLPADSSLVFYGEGGSGKTTLAIDLACHLAAGSEWIGFSIGRSCRVLLLENEGPRAEFRLKLRRKLATWDGPPIAGEILVLEEPWGQIDLRRDQDAAELAATLRDHTIDVLLAGPIRRLGLEGGGTPAETVAFMRLIDRVRRDTGHPLAAVLVHHENKGGDISGAFEAEFDTVVHVKPADRDRTQLYFRKSRWSSSIHRSRATLAWINERDGFDLVETDIGGNRSAAARDTADLEALDWIVEHVTQTPGLARGAAETAYTEAHPERGSRARARRVIDTQIRLAEALAEDGDADPERRTLPKLAIRNGERGTGKYLYPAPQAGSPLAEAPNGEPGENPSAPFADDTVRQLAAAYREGGERRTDGEGHPKPEELEWR